MIEWSPLLDTGICLAYARKGSLGVWIENEYRLLARHEKPFISVVTHGELLALALKFNWGETRIRELNELIEQMTILDINETDVLQSYAETDAYCRSLNPSVNMQKNDLWIAATAHAFDMTLMTTDRVFDHLHPDWLNRIYVDERSAIR